MKSLHIFFQRIPFHILRLLFISAIGITAASCATTEFFPKELAAIPTEELACISFGELTVSGYVQPVKQGICVTRIDGMDYSQPSDTAVSVYLLPGPHSFTGVSQNLNRNALAGTASLTSFKFNIARIDLKKGTKYEISETSPQARSLFLNHPELFCIVYSSQAVLVVERVAKSK